MDAAAAFIAVRGAIAARTVPVVVAPQIGVFYGGRGYWDGHRYWMHRDRWHDGWRYR